MTDTKQTLDTPEISTLQCVSTSHLSPTDIRILTNASQNEEAPLGALSGPYGWLVKIPENPETLAHSLTPTVIDILKKAAQNKCSYVMFDRDGPKVERCMEQWVD